MLQVWIELISTDRWRYFEFLLLPSHVLIWARSFVHDLCGSFLLDSDRDWCHSISSKTWTTWLQQSNPEAPNSRLKMGWQSTSIWCYERHIRLSWQDDLQIDNQYASIEVLLECVKMNCERGNRRREKGTTLGPTILDQNLIRRFDPSFHSIWCFHSIHS